MKTHKVFAYVTYEVVAEFEDDGVLALRDQALDAVRMEQPSGEVVDTIIKEIE